MKTIRFSRTALGCFKSISLASAVCCAGLANAQSGEGVTLYGLVDVGITSVSGLKAGTVTQVASGIMEGSRWGLKGTEDMGGGYKAIFTLEARVEADTGATSNRPISGNQISDRLSQAPLMGLTSPSPTIQGAYQAAVNGIVGSAASPGTILSEFGVNVGSAGNRAFDRQAFVGLITPVGAVLGGRMYTPAYETFGTFDSMATQSALSAGQIVQFPAVFEIRSSNALAYRIVKDGISGSVMYAPGELAGSRKNLIGFNAGYKSQAFAVGLGYNTKNNELGDKSLTSTVLGASMNFGNRTISTLVARMVDDHPADLSTIAGLLTPGLVAQAGPTLGPVIAAQVQDAFINAFKQDGTLFHIGYRFETGPNTVTVAYNHYDDKRPANADVSSYGAAYTYSLSKRTDLNAVAVRFDNKNLAQVAPGGNGYLGGVTASAGTGSTGLAVGVRHRF
jgi:predicted porin